VVTQAINYVSDPSNFVVILGYSDLDIVSKVAPYYTNVDVTLTASVVKGTSTSSTSFIVKLKNPCIESAYSSITLPAEPTF